eukprot:gene271-282_t
MLFNHRLPKDVSHKWWEWPVTPVEAQRAEAHAIYTPVFHDATRDISAGEEIFTSYGDDSWFSLRGIPLNDTIPDRIQYDWEKLSEVGHCLSDVSLNESTLPLAGKGIFAERDFKKDEIVSISPVLIIPKHELQAINEETVLYNYVITSEGSDVAVFPVGQAALINHGGSDSNVELTWYEWPGDDISVHLKLSAEELAKSRVSKLDLAYRATRDIQKGEELFLFYGEDWEVSWVKHLDRLMDWTEEVGTDDPESFLYSKPLFRHSIDAPPGLFPKWWKTPCIGTKCEMINRQAEIDADPELKDKQ